MLFFTFNFHAIIIWCSSRIIYNISHFFKPILQSILNMSSCFPSKEESVIYSECGNISHFCVTMNLIAILGSRLSLHCFEIASTPGCAMVIFSKFSKHRFSFIQVWGNMAGLNIFSDKWNHGSVSIILIVKHFFRSIFLRELFFSNFM